MSGFILTTHAQEDARTLWSYLSEEAGQSTADRVLSEIWDAMDRLVQYPKLGHTRTDLTELPLRFWSIYSYMIVYMDDSVPLTIVGVVHASRDLPRILPGRVDLLK